jgi:uncharacterized membrane protein YhaH (DUF805 family)
MTILQLYIGTSGRISRETWWYGAVPLGVLHFLATKLVRLILQYDRVPVGASERATIKFELVVATERSLWSYHWASLGWTVTFCALAWGLCVKRRHDCGASGWEVAALLAVSVLQAMTQLVDNVLPRASVSSPLSKLDIAAFVVTSTVGVLYLLFALYVLTTLGLLKGQTGTNRYGPDPKAPPVTAQLSQ